MEAAQRAMEEATKRMEEASRKAMQKEREQREMERERERDRERERERERSERENKDPQHPPTIKSPSDEPPLKRLATEEERLMAHVGMPSAHLKITSRGPYIMSEFTFLYYNYILF